MNTQQTRTRFWDGKDNMFRDDISMLKGNHLFAVRRHLSAQQQLPQRTDNGGGINYQPVYQLGTTTGAGTGVTLAPSPWAATGSASDLGP